VNAVAGILIVTGGSRGIGAATVQLAAKAGWDVCVNYVRDREKAEAVAAEARGQGVRAITVQSDMAREDDILRLFSTVDDQLGTVTGLVNNAGITGPAGKLLDLTAETVSSVMTLNVVGPFLCAREAARRMAKSRGGNGGVIVNVPSRASAIGSPNEFVHYAASKGAIDSFTIGLSKELAPEGIRVNAVNPGLIETEIHDASGIPGRLERLVGGVPQGRTGKAEEVAQAIVWLLSDQSSYVAGAFIPVSGGR
jgi:NAD(P)-dependent dehydrogenase (short-subunit alcohol dehydrogenase family)